jgi:poly(A) polymerase
MAGQQRAPGGDGARARDALCRAVACAASGTADRPLVLTAPEDFVGLDPNELRGILDSVLMGGHPAEGIQALLDCGALQVLLPEVSALVGFSDAEWRHKDVWKHSKQVLQQSPPRLAVRWAALLHDIGKVRTRSITPDGEVHFIGHAEVGARMFDRLARRQCWFDDDPELRAQIRFLIRHHLRASQYDGSWTDSAVRRFAREMGAHLDDLFCLSRADITTKRPHKRGRGVAMIDQLAVRISALAAQDAKLPPLPSGLGNELMTAFALPPSRRIGELKSALEAAVEAGELEPQRESAYYVKFIADHPDRFKL